MKLFLKTVYYLTCPIDLNALDENQCNLKTYQLEQ